MIPSRVDDLIIQAPAPATDFPQAPAGSLQFLDFNYYWNFFVSLPMAYKVGLVALAALLYLAIRHQQRS